MSMNNWKLYSLLDMVKTFARVFKYNIRILRIIKWVVHRLEGRERLVEVVIRKVYIGTLNIYNRMGKEGSEKIKEDMIITTLGKNEGAIS